ncbi:MAG: glycosyl hydrolase, partial [Saprospiraceae bacterium]
MKAFTKRIDKVDENLKPILDLADDIDSTMTAVEEALYQTKNRSGQDPLNFPIKLTNKLGHLTSITQGDYPPTQQTREVQRELTEEIDSWLDVFKKVKEQKLPEFNRLVREKEVDVISVKEE